MVLFSGPAEHLIVNIRAVSDAAGASLEAILSDAVAAAAVNAALTYRFGHVRPFFLLPLRQGAPHTAARPHTHFRRIELPEPEQIEHGFMVQERALPREGDSDRRLSARRRQHVAVRVEALAVRAERAAGSELSHLDSGHSCVLRLGDGHHAIMGCRNLPQVTSIAHPSHLEINVPLSVLFWHSMFVRSRRPDGWVRSGFSD